MTRRKKVLVVVAGLVLVASGIVVFLLQNADQPLSIDKDTAQRANKSAEAPKAPALPTSGTIRKHACDLLNNQLATETLGQKGVKNDAATSITTPEFRSTSCEYDGDNKKANITLYEYRSAAEAQAGKANAQTQRLVTEDGGKKTSIQPKSSVAEEKGSFVVTATVTVDDEFDRGKSEQLLKSIVGRL